MHSGTLYAQIGGDDGLRDLTSRFYQLMDELPEAAACRKIHPPSLQDSEEKLFEYLSGWLGGPPLFTEKRGPPMLRQRHLHAKVGTEEIAGWLLCFRQAWRETVHNPALTETVMPRVEALAQHMQNMHT